MTTCRQQWRLASLTASIAGIRPYWLIWSLRHVLPICGLLYSPFSLIQNSSFKAGQKGVIISRLSERAQLLVDLGVDLVITQLFDEQVRMTRAREFIGRLQAAVHLRQLWGGNFSLGHRREGDYDYLSRLGQEQGLPSTLKQNLVMANGERVSSSRIRRGLASGDIDDVNACLGRAFRVSGEVVQGAQRDVLSAFPANVAAWEQQLLPNGVYATIVRVGEQRYAAATNVGVRPTVAGNDGDGRSALSRLRR